MTTQIIDFSDIDLTGGLRFNGEAIGAAHYNGERLWPFGVDLLYTGGIGGASYLPDTGTVFADTAAATPAALGGSIARVNPSGGQSINALQSSIAFCPLLGRAPKAGRRNQITFSEQFDNPAFTKVGGTITPNAAVAPDGETTADQLVEGAGTVNGASIRRTNPSFWLGIMGLSAAISIHAKEVVGSAKRYLVLGADTGSTRWAYIIVDLATGAITATRTDGIQTGVIAGSAVVEPAENGYYRVSLAVSSPLAANTYLLRAGITDTPTPTFTTADIPAYTGDGASGLMLWGFQAEPGSVVSAYQRIGANLDDVTEHGVPSYPFVRFDLSDDRLDTVLSQAVTGDVVIAGRNGSVIAPHSYAANATFQLGPASYTGGTPGILSAIGDVVGWSILNKTLTAAERDRLMRFYKRRGAKGLLVPGGPELAPPSSNLIGYFNEVSAATLSQVGDELSVTVTSNFGGANRLDFSFKPLGFYLVTMQLKSGDGRFTIDNAAFSSFVNITFSGPTTFIGVAQARVDGLLRPNVRTQTAGGTTVWTGFSIRELRPEEDW